MPPDAPTFLPVPPYASQYLRVATNLRSPFSEPVNLRMSLTNIHDRPHNLWSSPHHLRSFIGSATQMSGDSKIQCLGDSAIRRFGDSAIRRFGDSAIRRFGGSQPPPNNLRRNHGSFDLGPLSLIPAPASASPWFTSSPGCWPRSGELLARFAYSGSCTEGPPAVRRFGGSQPPPNHLRNLSPSCISPSNLALKPPSSPAS
ncbi:hypothetical protein GGX14DRAFT_572568 [Mycena pura]|uniref:Uncharacterized protein n=1 Tax=Mycena pura TaxID=153505 RepID=A0AAD6V1C8_9AGAR|nr:hypothetical protein GGX14DRAFT_572568 [Mycena pura]